LVMWLFYNQSAYWHFHITPAGIIIEHSHPFTNSASPDTPFQKHHHSDFEYSILTQISNAFSLIVFLMAAILIFQKQSKDYQNPDLITIKTHDYLNSHRLRGPPIC
jgi:hypothetical protein